jgi:hypothetical protein
MGRKSRDKGCRGEREAAGELRRLFKVEARRGRQYAGGDESPDVVTAIDDVHSEVKRVEALRLWAAIGQAVDDAGDKIPVVLHKANRKPWVAIVRLDDLPELAVQLYLTMAQNN